jgi:ferritin-like metal-binding protein YciE
MQPFSTEQAMNSQQLTELLLQSLEHERGGVKIYQIAIECAQREDLRSEWKKYLSETEEHVATLTRVCEVFEIDPFTTTPGTQIVKAVGASLVQAMQAALAAANPAAAQMVAAECVVLAETKDHLNWELLGKAAEQLTGDERDVLMAAYERIEDEEDEHLYHTQGWCRELWLQSLGIDAELPPAEEKRDVTTAAEAQRAKETRQPRH